MHACLLARLLVCKHSASPPICLLASMPVSLAVSLPFCLYLSARLTHCLPACEVYGSLPRLMSVYGYVYNSPAAHLPGRLPVYLSVGLSVCLWVCLSFYLPTSLQSACCPASCLFVCPPVRMHVCLPGCMHPACLQHGSHIHQSKDQYVVRAMTHVTGYSEWAANCIHNYPYIEYSYHHT